MQILKYGVQSLKIYKLEIFKSALKVNRLLFIDSHIHKFHLKLLNI